MQLDGRLPGGYHDSLFSMLDKERPFHDSVSIATYYHKHAEISSKTFSALENEPLITIMRALAKALESVQHESTFSGLSDIDHSRWVAETQLDTLQYLCEVRTTCAYILR